MLLIFPNEIWFHILKFIDTPEALNKLLSLSKRITLKCHDSYINQRSIYNLYFRGSHNKNQIIKNLSQRGCSQVIKFILNTSSKLLKIRYTHLQAAISSGKYIGCSRFLLNELSKYTVVGTEQCACFQEKLNDIYLRHLVDRKLFSIDLCLHLGVNIKKKNIYKFLDENDTSIFVYKNLKLYCDTIKDDTNWEYRLLFYFCIKELMTVNAQNVKHFYKYKMYLDQHCLHFLVAGLKSHSSNFQFYILYRLIPDLIKQTHVHINLETLYVASLTNCTSDCFSVLLEHVWNMSNQNKNELIHSVFLYCIRFDRKHYFEIIIRKFGEIGENWKLTKYLDYAVKYRAFECISFFVEKTELQSYDISILPSSWNSSNYYAYKIKLLLKAGVTLPDIQYVMNTLSLEEPKIFVGLLKSPKYRDKFINHCLYHNNPEFYNRLTHFINGISEG